MKDCLIIGPAYVFHYNDVYPLLLDKTLQVGVWTIGWGNICCNWFTTLKVNRPDEKKLVLTKTYNPQDYPRYDNYDAIEVSRYADIPIDYEGLMGVPITVLEKSLDNVVIEGRGGDIEWAETECGFYTPPTEDKVEKYKAGNETWRIQNPYLLVHDKPVVPYNRVFIKLEGLLYGEYTEIDGKYIKGHRPILNGKQMYSRVLIKKLQI